MNTDLNKAICIAATAIGQLEAFLGDDHRLINKLKKQLNELTGGKL
jgi:hypothetical protein